MQTDFIQHTIAIDTVGIQKFLYIQLCKDISSALDRSDVEINYGSLSHDLRQVSNIESIKVEDINHGKIKKYTVSVSY